MPPGLSIVGRVAIAEFLATAVFDHGRSVRLDPVPTNAETAFLLSSRRPTDAAFEPYAVLVVGLDAADSGDAIVSRMTVFTDARLVARFAGRGAAA